MDWYNGKYVEKVVYTKHFGLKTDKEKRNEQMNPKLSGACFIFAT
jgi:hypothetical protein